MKNGIVKNSLGRFGEDLACRFLKKRGYRILQRNYRKPWGEIDIIGRAPDRTLVFFEVKTLREGEGENSLQPEDNMTAAKLRKLRTVCAGFVAKNPRLINEESGWRIDVLAITVPRGTMKIKGENCAITHYENV